MTITSCGKIVTPLLFSGFLANLEQSRSRIPDTESAKVMFSVKVSFCLTKTENRTTKKPNTALTILLWVKVLFWTKNANFLQKKMLTSAKLRGPRHQKVYFLKLHMGLYLRAKSEVSSIILTSFRQGGWGGGVIKSPPKFANFTGKNSRILRIKNAKFLVCFYMNTNV